MSLQDLAVEILNEAKLLGDSKQKLYKLEQIKEICLHRDPSILPLLIPEFMFFMMEKSMPLRRFLLLFLVEVSNLYPDYVEHMISLCHFLIHDDYSNEFLIKSVANSLMKVYSQVSIYLVKLPTSSPKATSHVKSLWTNLQAVTSKLLFLLSSDSSDDLRAQVLRFSEEVILFSLPSSSESFDPRVAKVTKKANVNDVPVHHPCINPKQLEQDADSLFNKMLLWLSKTGPQGFSFSPALMSQLVASISVISTQRPSRLLNAAKACYLFMKDKSSVHQAMDMEAKEHLLRALQRMLPVALSLPNLAEIAAKLKESIQSFSVHGTDSTGRDLNLVRKRSYNETAPTFEEGEEERKAAIIAALDTAEREMKIQKTSASSAVVGPAAPNNAELELITDLFPLPPTAMPDAAMMLPASQLQGGAMSKKHDDLSFQSLHRVLETSVCRPSLSADAQRTIIRVGIRMVLLLAYADLEGGRSFISVRVLVSSVASMRSQYSLPTEVSLPRPIWFAISFCLGKIDAAPTVKASKLSRKPADEAMAILTTLLTEMFSRSHPPGVGDGEEFGTKTDGRSLYGDAVYATASRCMEKKALRSHLKTFLLSIPQVPTPTIHLIAMIATRTIEKGATIELMSLLRDLALGAVSEVTRDRALRTLLWFCVDENFDIRIKAVLLARDLLEKDDVVSAADDIIEFAKQAAIHIVGKEAVLNTERMECPSSSHSRIESIQECALRYDGGMTFQGEFAALSTLDLIPERREVYLRRHLYLLMQTALRQRGLLVFVAQLFAVNENTILRWKEMDQGDQVLAGEQLRRLLLADVTAILPVLFLSQTVEEVLDLLLDTPSSAVSIILLVLQEAYKEERIPPSITVVSKVRAYAAKLSDEDSLKVQMLIIGGLTPDEVEKLLPKIVKYFGAQKLGKDELGKVLVRIIRARPPPMSKVSLLLKLHRMDVKVDQKAILDSIEVCLSNKTDFKADIIKEVLSCLLLDEVPALPIMRTAIRCSQTLGLDVRLFVVGEVIPALIKKQVWITSPRVWEGVAFAAKMLIEQKEVDFKVATVKDMLRAVLGLPLQQLQCVLQNAPKLKSPLLEYANALNADEKYDVIGRNSSDVLLSDEEKDQLVKNRLDALSSH